MLGYVPGHMTKIASRPMFGKNLQKSPSSEPRGRWPWSLVHSIGYSRTTKFVQMMTLVWHWPFLWHGQICFQMLLHGWKLIQHIVMYFGACSNSAYPMHSGERYRTAYPMHSGERYRTLFFIVIILCQNLMQGKLYWTFYSWNEVWSDFGEI